MSIGYSSILFLWKCKIHIFIHLRPSLYKNVTIHSFIKINRFLIRNFADLSEFRYHLC